MSKVPASLNWRRWAAGALSASALLGQMALAPQARAQTITQQVFARYDLKGISAWPNGSSSGSATSILLGPSWNIGPDTAGGFFDLKIPSFSIGPVHFPSVDLGRTGADVSFGGSGALGLQATPWYNGGTMDVSYGAGVALTYPEFPTANSQVTVSAAFTADSGSSFTTYTPQFGISLGAVFNLSGYANGAIDFAGDSLWSGTILPSFSFGSTTPKMLGGFTDLSNTDQINYLVGQLNPLPVGASIYTPTVAANAYLPDSSGQLKANAFGKFLSVETDALSWIALLFGDDKPAIFAVLNGDYFVPDTSLEVSWDIAKAYADLDIGYQGTYTLVPKPQITLQVFDQNQKLLASGGSTVSFKFPATGGVSIVPKLTLDLQFRNQLAFGTQGSIGINPFEVAVKGGYGSGLNAQTLDIDVAPANEDWTSNTSGGTPFVDQTFDLPLTANQRTQALAAIGLNPADLTDLPREVFAGAAPNRTIQLQAYSPDSDKDYASVDIVPEQGRTFLYGSNGNSQTLSATILDNQTGLTDIVNIGFRDNTNVTLQIPTKYLSPGQTSVRLFVSGENSLHQLKTAIYTLVTTIYDKTPNIDGEFFTAADLEAGEETNRVVANGHDQWIYCAADGIYKTTKALLNTPTGTIVLPTDITSDQDVTGRSYIGIKIPAHIADEYAGGPMTIQLQNPNLKTDSNGNALPPLLSTPKSIYFVAAKPSIHAILIHGAATPIPIGNSPVVLAVSGFNFTKLTTVYLQGIKNASDIQRLPVSFSSPFLIYVTVPANVVALSHDYQRFNAQLFASTPFAQIPPDSGNQSAVNSGGLSDGVGVKFAYPAPVITNIDSSDLVRLVDNKLVITGSNLFRQPMNSKTSVTTVTIQGEKVPAADITYSRGSGINAASLTVSLPSTDVNLQRTGSRDLFVFNDSVSSAKSNLQVVNGEPNVSATSFDLLVGPGLTNTITVPGGPFYPESRFTVNGTNLPDRAASMTSFVAQLSFSQLSGLTGPTAQAVVFTPTPGGGTSSPITLRLLERDPSTITITKGSLTYDRATQTWAQPLTCTYGGTRILDTTAELQLSGLPSGVTLVNADGVDGVPYKSVHLVNGSATTIVARFHRPAGAVISYTAGVKFSN